MSKARRVSRKSDRTPVELAELKAEREQLSRDRPGPEDVLATGEFEGPFPQGAVMTLLSALASLKRERERRAMTLEDVATASGLDTGMLSRLENGRILNPTMSTLWRYASAVGVELRLDARVPAAS